MQVSLCVSVSIWVCLHSYSWPISLPSAAWLCPSSSLSDSQCVSSFREPGLMSALPGACHIMRSNNPWNDCSLFLTLLLSNLVSLYSSFSSPRFPRTTLLHAPLSCWGHEHHKDGVCSACAYTHSRARVRCGWTDVCMLQHSWEMWRGMCVHMPNLKWEHLNKYKGTCAVPLNPH